MNSLTPPQGVLKVQTKTWYIVINGISGGSNEKPIAVLIIFSLNLFIFSFSFWLMFFFFLIMKKGEGWEEGIMSKYKNSHISDA